jgi:hypothetical protein
MNNMDFENLTKAMIKHIPWVQKTETSYSFRSILGSYSYGLKVGTTKGYAHFGQLNEDRFYDTPELARQAAEDDYKELLMRFLAESIHFDLEQAFKQTYPDATITLNAEGWWEVRKTPNSKPCVYNDRTKFEAWYYALLFTT